MGRYKYKSRLSTPQKSKKKDIRLEVVRQVLIEPFKDSFGSWEEPLTDADRLHMAFGEGQREIHKRQVLGPAKVTGYWWENVRVGQWPRKNNRTLTLRWANDRCRYLYVREDFREKTVDIEVQVRDRVDRKQTIVWQCCTITEEEYKKLESFLGPREEPCKMKSHKRRA